MKSICKEIFRAIHEGKWLSIAYCNRAKSITKYWIGIESIGLSNRTLRVEGLHLGTYAISKLTIFIDSILSACVVDGTYFKTGREALEDIKCNPEKYRELFGNVANLKILSYLADCSRLDTCPYQCEYALIQQLDRDRLEKGDYSLTEEQFGAIVRSFQGVAGGKRRGCQLRQLGMNVLSLHTKKGLYILAYCRLDLDVQNKSLRAQEAVTVCKEFTVYGERQSIRKFLDAEDYELLYHFDENQEKIKDRITQRNASLCVVDDMPYLVAIGMDSPVDCNAEFHAVPDLYESGKASIPLRAFFGELVRRPIRRKEYPLALLNQKVNVDQLLAIHNAMKYPLAYIQGPPGTGKTNTIQNTISTAFFHDRTVLFVSYNNHPIDTVVESFRRLTYRGKPIPFPMIRLGNKAKMEQALVFIRQLYEQTKGIKIYDATLERDRDSKMERTKQLTELLRKHEEILYLKEKREALERLLKARGHLTFQMELREKQLTDIKKQLAELDDITDEDAQRLLSSEEEEFHKYLYYTSAKYIKRLDEPKNRDLLEILTLEDPDEQGKAFHDYLKQSENLKKFLRIFPIVATTCISAQKLGEPGPLFDMVIMDEASQSNTAVSLIPILRGESLMLVGDPQQLNPVILLGERENQILRLRYGVSEEYDYIKNSIYKTYLACDAVSDEVLLRCHYRCHRRIIDFSNQKYYGGRLTVKSEVTSSHPLRYIDVQDNPYDEKNTALGEAREILRYVESNRDRRIGVITPFVNQKNRILELLRQRGWKDIPCGTVHAFQGDERDVILFSLALTDQTHQKTYDWLKNNRELINVATSRAKQELVVLCSGKSLLRLHKKEEEDDLYELVEYVRSNGTTEVTPKAAGSRALGLKPYSTQTEDAFLENLNHALDNIPMESSRYAVHKEVPISQVFEENISLSSLFFTGRFDFVVYERQGRRQMPVLAIELDGKEHMEDQLVRERDRKKNEICRRHGFELIRIDNSYARRYHYIKEILIGYFLRAGK